MMALSLPNLLQKVDMFPLPLDQYLKDHQLALNFLVSGSTSPINRMEAD